MSNSSLVDYVKISPNSSNPRNKKIKKITLHHVAGNLTVKQIGNIFAPASRRASSNYGIDSNGRVGMYVEEKNRAWTSGSADNDHQAITIEVANSKSGNPWPVSDKALNKLIELCVDICRRNGIDRLNYTGDASGNFTRHNMFQATACPGPYLISKMPYIADEVNRRLSDTSSGLYRVQIGAYAVKANAEAALKKARAAGFKDAFITATGAAVAPAPKPAPAPAPTPKPAAIKVGSRVRVKKGAKDYNGVQLASFVFNRVYSVIQISGDRAVIGEGKAVTAAVRAKDLIPV
jgi:hypothetical protein